MVINPRQHAWYMGSWIHRIHRCKVHGFMVQYRVLGILIDGLMDSDRPNPEHVRQKPNRMSGRIGRTQFGLSNYSWAKKQFGSAEIGFGRSLIMATIPLHGQKGMWYISTWFRQKIWVEVKIFGGRILVGAKMLLFMFRYNVVLLKLFGVQMKIGVGIL